MGVKDEEPKRPPKKLLYYYGIILLITVPVSYTHLTTMLMMCIMPTAIMQFHYLISSKKLRNIVNAFCGIYASFMVIGRVLSGVHSVSYTHLWRN